MEWWVSDEFDPYAIGKCSPPLSADSVTSFIQTPFLPAPNTRKFNATKTTTDTSSFMTRWSKLGGLSFDHLKFQGFESPSYSRITILILLCLITYPAFY